MTEPENFDDELFADLYVSVIFSRQGAHADRTTDTMTTNPHTSQQPRLRQTNTRPCKPLLRSRTKLQKMLASTKTITITGGRMRK
jgi:hypothetical protein